MRTLAIWAATVSVAFAALAGVTTATRNTQQVFVVVDGSFFMEDVATRIPTELERIDDRTYTEFALATVSDQTNDSIHGYRADLDWNDPTLFGPCSFDGLEDYPEASSADERILITSVGSCDTSGLDGWTIVELDR